MTARNPRYRISAIALSSLLAASSCSILPPSLRKEHEPKTTVTGATLVPAAPPAATPPAAQSQAQANRLFAGTGVFVNPNPPAAAPGG